MLLAQDALTIVGVVVGFGLWLGLVYAVYRWGPFEDETSIVRAFRAVTRRGEGDPRG